MAQRSDFHKGIHARRENWLSARGFTGYHALSGSPAVPRGRYALARSRRLGLRPGAMQTPTWPVYSKLQRRSAPVCPQNRSKTKSSLRLGRGFLLLKCGFGGFLPFKVTWIFARSPPQIFESENRTGGFSSASPVLKTTCIQDGPSQTI